MAKSFFDALAQAAKDGAALRAEEQAAARAAEEAEKALKKKVADACGHFATAIRQCKPHIPESILEEGDLELTLTPPKSDPVHITGKVWFFFYDPKDVSIWRQERVIVVGVNNYPRAHRVHFAGGTLRHRTSNGKREISEKDFTVFGNCALDEVTADAAMTTVENIIKKLLPYLSRDDAS